MNNKNVYNFSNADVLRHVVIDHSVFIEGLVTTTICSILEIDSKESKALGSGSASLNFSQKVQLIIDKAGEQTDDSKKILAFTHIRNKFAHLADVETWDQFFSLSDTYNDVKKKLLKWYMSEEVSEKNSEDEFRVLYYYLTIDILKFLTDKITDWAYKKGKDDTELRIHKILFDLVKGKKDDSEEIKVLWNQMVETIENPNFLGKMP